MGAERDQTRGTPVCVFDREDASGRKWKPATLAQFLENDKVPLEVIRKTHPHTHFMVTQVLGCEPLSACYAEINPPSLLIRDTIVPNLLNIPFSDFGMGVDPALRASVMYCASRSFGCMYCSSHSVGFGTVQRGGGEFLDVVSRAYDEDLRKGTFSPREKAALDFAKAVTPAPARVSGTHRIALARSYSEAHEEIIVMICAAMSFLSRMMDTLGMPLEYTALRNAENYLQPDVREDVSPEEFTRWSPGQHISPLDLERLDEEYKDYVSKMTEGNNPSMSHVIFQMIQCAVQDEKRKMGVPMLRGRMKDYLRRLLGFCPYYLVRITSPLARRSVAFAIARGWSIEENQQAPPALKYAMLYLQACRASNDILRAHYAFLAYRNGMPLTYLCEVASGRFSDSEMFSPSEALALELAEGASSTPGKIPPHLAERIAEKFKPATIVDFVITMAIGSMVHVISSAYPPTEYEDEIAKFVEEANRCSQIHLRRPDAPWPMWDSAANAYRSCKSTISDSNSGLSSNSNSSSNESLRAQVLRSPFANGTQRKRSAKQS